MGSPRWVVEWVASLVDDGHRVALTEGNWAGERGEGMGEVVG